MSTRRVHSAEGILPKLLRLFRGLAILTLWLIGGGLAWITAILLITDFATGCKFAMAASLVVGGYRGLASAWEHRRELARNAAHPPPTDESRPYRNSRVECLHPTRGTGWLVVNEHGGLHFRASPSGAAKNIAYFGMEIETVGLLQLVGRRLKAFFCPRFREDLDERDRDLAIPREQLRLVLPFSRFVMGPTALVGYEVPGEKELRFEEFCLCTVAGNQVRTPTADAAGWARDLGLPEAPAGLRGPIERRRAAVRRRLALADMGVAVVVSGTIVLGLAGACGVLVATELGAAQGAALFGILAGIWTAAMALCGICHLYCNR